MFTRPNGVYSQLLKDLGVPWQTFLDGNGRVGRLLIVFMLINAGVIKEPLLYLSLFFKQHRQTYYDLLDSIRQTGEWEKWLDFFLQGVREAAEGAEYATQRLIHLFDQDEKRINQEPRSQSAQRVLQAFKAQPVLQVQDVQKHSDLSFNAASSAIGVLERLNIVKEITGQRRNRIYQYVAYIDILSEGTEPL